MKALFCLFPFILWGIDIEFKNINHEYIPLENSSLSKKHYELTALSHIVKLNKKSYKELFFNREHYMLTNRYYLRGRLETKEASLNFKKAYILDGKVYLFEVKGNVCNYKVNAKKIIYNEDEKYILKEGELQNKNRIVRRKKYSFSCLLLSKLKR